MKGHIRIKEKVYFEPEGLEKPSQSAPKFWDKHGALNYWKFRKAVEKYKDSKRLIEVSNFRKEFDKIISISINDSYKNNFGMSEIKNNQKCKAEVTDNKATIIELTEQ